MRGTWPSGCPRRWRCCGPVRSVNGTPASWSTPPDPCRSTRSRRWKPRCSGGQPELTATQFRAAVKRAVLRVTDPADEEAAHRDAVAERRVIFTPVESGMTELWAYLSAGSAAIIRTTLDAMAHTTIHRAGGDERSADQRRADALVDLARTALTDPHAGGPRGRGGITRLAPGPAGPRHQLDWTASTGPGWLVVMGSDRRCR